MAQFFTDFSGDTIGSLPSYLTLYGAVTSLVESDAAAANGVSLRMNRESGPGARGAILNTFPARQYGRVESVSRIRISSTSHIVNFSVGNLGNTPRIQIENGLRIYRTTNTLASIPNVLPIDTFQWYRMVRDPIQNIMAGKIWVDGDPEPSEWGVYWDSDAVSNPEDTLRFFFSSSVFSSHWVDVAGIGTDGDPAPTGPLSTTEAFALRHNPRTNKVIPVLSSPTVTDIGANCVRPRVTKGY